MAKYNLGGQQQEKQSQSKSNYNVSEDSAGIHRKKREQKAEDKLEKESIKSGRSTASRSITG